MSVVGANPTPSQQPQPPAPSSTPPSGFLKRATSLIKPSGQLHRALVPVGPAIPDVVTSPQELSVSGGPSSFKTYVKSKGLALKSIGRSSTSVVPKIPPPPSAHHRTLSESNGRSGSRRTDLPSPTTAGFEVIRSTTATAPPRSAPALRTSRSIRYTRPYNKAPMDETLAPHEPMEAHGILPLPEGSQAEQFELIEEIKIPALLQQGTPMMKMSAKKGPQVRKFRLDAEQGQILWESKKFGTISIENIREMRTGANARNYREYYKMSAEYEPRWLTIVYTFEETYKTLHVIALSLDVFNMWNSTLRTLYALRREMMSGLASMERRQLVWEKQYWKGADASGDSKLDFAEVQKMCQRLNIYPAREDLLKKFNDADSDHDGLLDFTDFQKFVKLLKTRPDIDRLFEGYAPNGAMEFFAFENFMRETQKSNLPTPDLQHIFEKYSKPPQAAGHSTAAPAPAPTPAPTSATSQPDTKAIEGLKISDDGIPVPVHPVLERSLSSVAPTPEVEKIRMSLAAFTAFLLSSDNAPFTEQQTKVVHDMTRPMAEYYISASHNTYLIGNQLMGDSTTEGYIRALLQGCRSVELDIWDGEKEPCVYHGKTLTSRVSVRDISRAIAKYAFVASPYPVILSAEIHCKIEQQDMVAKIMREEFGPALITGPLPGREHESEVGVSELPSPEEMKGRILLKTKQLVVSENKPMETKTVTVDADSTTTETTTSSASEAEGQSAISRARGLMSKVKQKAPQMLRRPSPSGSSPASPPPGTQPKAKISTELTALLIYTVGVKCRGINKKETYDPVHLFSLSERTANKIMKMGMMDLIKHNRTHVIRLYPAAMRLNSSNYEPHRYWAAGAQLCAINWQTLDLGYMMNYAMFQRNGGLGYVLKPEPLRIKDKQTLGTRTTHFLDVTVVSAQQLPRPKDSKGREIVDKAILDPFVEVSVHIPEWSTGTGPFLPAEQKGNVAYSPPAGPSKSGVPSTTASTARSMSIRTKVVKNNGFNPVWQEEMSIPFDLVGGMKDLVFVRFEIRAKGEDEDHPIGVYCISLGSLQMGFRHLPLHDQQMSQYLFSTLFVKVEVRDAA